MDRHSGLYHGAQSPSSLRHINPCLPVYLLNGSQDGGAGGRGEWDTQSLYLDPGGLGGEGPGPGLSSFPGRKEEGGRLPPIPAASHLTPHLALCFLSSSHHPSLLAPHLTPDYLIKGKKLGSINDVLPPLLPPSPSPSLSLPVLFLPGHK